MRPDLAAICLGGLRFVALLVPRGRQIGVFHVQGWNLSLQARVVVSRRRASEEATRGINRTLASRHVGLRRCRRGRRPALVFPIHCHLGGIEISRQRGVRRGDQCGIGFPLSVGEGSASPNTKRKSSSRIATCGSASWRR